MTWWCRLRHGRFWEVQIGRIGLYVNRAEGVTLHAVVHCTRCRAHALLNNGGWKNSWPAA